MCGRARVSRHKRTPGRVAHVVRGQKERVNLDDAAATTATATATAVAAIATAAVTRTSSVTRVRVVAVCLDVRHYPTASTAEPTSPRMHPLMGCDGSCAGRVV